MRRKHRGLFESAGDAIIVMGLDGTVLEANESFYRICGHSREDVLGEGITEIIHPDQRRAFLGTFDLLGEIEKISESESFLLESRLVRKDGNAVFVEARLSRVLHRGREAVLAVVRDITDRKRAEARGKQGRKELEGRVRERTRELSETNEALRREILERQRAEQELQENRSMLQSVFDGISDPLVLLDNGFNVRMLNKAARTYYRMPEGAEAVGRACYEGLMGNPEPCAGCLLLPNILNGRAGSFERKGIVNEDRLEKVVLYPIERETKSSGAILRISDATEARKLERRIVQNEKLTVLGLLVGSITHDINNPNSFISLNIPILRDYLNELLPIIDEYAEKRPGYELFGMPYPAFRADLLKLLDNVEHGSNRIKNIVSDLREFVIKRQKREERFVDLKEVVNRAVAICGPEISKKVKIFEVNIPEDLPRIFTCPEDLELVLVNLLVNAAHAADKENGRIELRVLRGDPLSIEIQDNGCGMDDDTKERVFDPLFTTMPSAYGGGLGLYVSKTLVEGLGGKLELESELRKGSCFRIKLQEPKFESVHGGFPGPKPG
jgi:PAS domain S-box-containing protein